MRDCREEHHKQALSFQAAGNKFIKQGDYGGAAQQFEEAVEETLGATDRLPRLLQANIAAAFFKLKNPAAAHFYASAALTFKAQDLSLKAYYRSAKAAEELGYADAAVMELATLSMVDHANLRYKLTSPNSC